MNYIDVSPFIHLDDNSVAPPAVANGHFIISVHKWAATAFAIVLIAAEEIRWTILPRSRLHS